jgi:subtilisin family serine protease
MPPPTELIGLDALMGRTRGARSIPIGMIDGPVDSRHPALAHARLRAIGRPGPGACLVSESAACRHGTFTAGILAAERSSGAPGVCPDSTLLIRTIFTEPDDADAGGPWATPEQAATAIGDCVPAGARIVNLGLEVIGAGNERDQAELSAAVDRAAQQGVVLVAAAGNRAAVHGRALSRHPWIVNVAACDRRGGPLPGSNFGTSTGRRGVLAPGEAIVSLAPGGGTVARSGTSAAVAFVSGAIGLAWSLVPRASGNAVRWALTRVPATPRRSIVPPLLWAPLLAEQLRVASEDGHV